MSEIHCKLEGGVFDGDSGTLVFREERPEYFWAVPCANPFCQVGKIHWVFDPLIAKREGGERYSFDREDDGGVVYVHANADLSGLPSIHTEQPVTA